MKHFIALVVLTLGVTLSAWQIDSSYTIVIPKQCYDGSVQRFLKEGAVYLQTMLARQGKKLPIVTADKAVPGKKSIFLGFPDGKKYTDFNGSIRFDKGDIYITGNDSHTRNAKGRNNNFRFYYLGTIKSLTRFMELYLNVRFLMPGEKGTAILAGALPELPDSGEIKVVPSLVFSHGNWNDMFYDYANNCMGRGSFHTYGGHSWYSAVPLQKYAKSHPEYYAVIDGRRAPDITYWSLCISNPVVEELIYKELLKQLDAGADVCQLAQTDGYRECECANCQKLYNVTDPAERLWIFHTNLAKRLLKDRPGKKAMIIAYSPTFDPPKTFSEFPPNVVVELSRYTPEDFEKWSKVKVPGGFTTYIYNWGYYQVNGITPRFSTANAAEQVRLFLKNNVKGVYRCGFGTLFGLEGPGYYLYGKLFDDPDLNVEKCVQEYCEGAFGKAAAPAMAGFFKLIDEAIDKFPAKFFGKPVPLAERPETLLSAMWTSQRLKAMESQLLLAERAPKTTLEKERLAITRFQFNYLKNLMQIQFTYQAYTLNPSKELLKILLGLLKERENLQNTAYKGSTKLTFPGFPHIFYLNAPAQAFPTNGRLHALLAAPYTWNVKAISSKDILPGVSVKKMEVPQVSGKVGMDFAQGVWKDIPWQELSEIQLNPLKTQSRFKAVYDKEKFYVAVESDLPDTKTFSPLGHDKKCWEFDSIDLVVDPWGSREKYYHFITNPVANSFYESAVGLIEDPLHPLFRGMDPSWNGKWSYKCFRKNNRWYVLYELPFATLGKTPKAGDVWTFNVCREAKGPGRSNDRELSCWSPCFEAFSFHEKSTFGELYFK